MALLVWFTLAPAPHARAEALAICHDGGPGSTKQAAKAVETFLRHTEATAGLAPNSLTGEYHTKRKHCDAYVQANSPVLVVLDLATHLSKANAWGLQPIAHLGKADTVRWHIVVREGAYPDLGSLDGKTVLSTAPDDSAFLNRIVLAGRSHRLTFEHTRRALKALRSVGRGKAEAALVDHEAVAHMGSLDLPHKLVSIYSSEGLPGLTMSARGSGDTVSRVQRALPKLCDGDGRKLCKTFKVKRFQSADPRRLRGLLKRRGGGS
ncbi:MAG: hypothetical protein QF464_03450 [Myxococcota bacterium]|jgi:hypothetical protein|nr:hypothetical protein [Myxococcota bacterium]